MYDAWGVNRESTGTTEYPFRWVGEKGYYTDKELGSVAVRRRVYEPKDGRWMSQDPLGFVDGVNEYVYGINSPVTLIDTQGTQAMRPLFRKQQPTIVKFGKWTTELESISGLQDRRGGFRMFWKLSIRRTRSVFRPKTFQLWLLTKIERAVIPFGDRVPLKVRYQYDGQRIKDRKADGGLLVARDEQWSKVPVDGCQFEEKRTLRGGLNSFTGRRPNLVTTAKSETPNAIDLKLLQTPREMYTFSFTYRAVNARRCGDQPVCSDLAFFGFPDVFEWLETPWGWPDENLASCWCSFIRVLFRGHPVW